MKATYKFVFNRKKKLNAEGKAPVELLIVIGRKKKYKNTKIFLKPEEWNTKKNCVSEKSPNYTYQNKFLKQIIFELEKNEFIQIESGNTDIRFEDILPKTKNDIGSGNFCEWVQQKLDKNNSIQAVTKKKHQNFNTVLKQIKPNLRFSDLNYSFVTEFDNSIRARSTVHSPNTVHSYHRIFKRYIHEALKEGLLQKNPYDNFTLKKSPTTRTSLEMDELERIEKFVFGQEFATVKINLIRNMFLFSCYTGLRFGDIMQLEAKHFIESPEGLKLYLEKQEKTEKDKYLPLHIIFNGKPENLIKPYLEKAVGKIFPPLSNGYVNRVLKIIAVVCNIKKVLSFHVSRHTFGTLLANITGDPYIVKDLMSHGDIRTSMEYIHRSQGQQDKKLKSINWNV